MSYPTETSVVIIGAGPFGLSIAAHLRSTSVSFRIFGMPMHRWLRHMPCGMFLKSEGRASSLSEPSGRYTLARFCKEKGLPYGERALPVAIETFTEYALSFQRKFVPQVEQVLVSLVERTQNGYEVRLQDGSRIRARNVIVATGLENTAYIPPELAHLPTCLASHSSEHCDLRRFGGKDVTVVGGGQSALESAALLSEFGARVRVLARRAVLQWNSAPKLTPQSLYRRLRYPVSNLGEGLQLWLFCAAPNVFHYFPRPLRIAKVTNVLNAAGSWWLRGRVEGKLDLVTGREISKAEVRNGRVMLQIRGPHREVSEFETDYVIAATGYKYDVHKLSFLSGNLKASVKTENQRPLLSLNFEATVPGLYFAGMASAYSFGPAMRFIEGARHTARTLAAHLAAEGNRHAPLRSEKAVTV